MTARRLPSPVRAGLLAASLAAFVASVVVSIVASIVAAPSVAAAQPRAKQTPKAPAKKRPLAPAKDAGDGAAPARQAAPASGGADDGAAARRPGAAGQGAGPASTTAAPAADAPAGAAGATVQMVEDPPPRDATGIEENPEAPRIAGDPEGSGVVASAALVRDPSVYPVELAVRPITMLQNMSEVALTPHAQVSPHAATTALRARYGVTSTVQLGLTYVIGGIFRDPASPQSGQGFHPGKAVGLDVTVMLQPWIGVSAGLPIYINPLAFSLALGAPIKFTFGDKFAIGGLDDLLNIRLSRFAPTFYQEVQNVANAQANVSNTIHSDGQLRISLYGIYQYRPNVAVIGRAGVQMDDFATGNTDACLGECATTFISAGFNYSPRSYLDLGLAIGFDDLAHGGTFAPAGYLAFRI